MTFDYRVGIALLEIIIYIPSFFFALWISARHGFNKSSGWIYLTILTIARIVGASLQLDTITNHSVGVKIASSICASVGLSLLILACLGVLSRVNGSSIRPLSSLAFQPVQLISLVGVILAIVGGVNSSSSPVPTQVNSKTKVGVVLFLLAWLALCILLAIITIRISSVEPGEKRLVLAVAISVPLILVRLIYSLLGSFSKNHAFSSITGSVTINLCMAVIEEFVVVIVLLGTGFTLRVLPKPGIAAPIPRSSYPEYDQLNYAENGAVAGGHAQQNARTDHGSRRTLPRREMRRSGRRGGPITQLIGLARDRYQSR